MNTDMNKSTGWIQTFTGLKFYPLEPDVDAVTLEDVAHALAMKCRFNGHSSHFYSVAQHSVIMSWQFNDNPYLAMWALLHDSGEAYLADIPRPVKPFMGIQTEDGFMRFAELETNVRVAIFKRIAPMIDGRVEPSPVKDVDTRILLNEAEMLMFKENQNKSMWDALADVEPLKIPHMFPWTWQIAKNLFIMRYNELSDRLYVAVPK